VRSAFRRRSQAEDALWAIRRRNDAAVAVAVELEGPFPFPLRPSTTPLLSNGPIRLRRDCRNAGSAASNFDEKASGSGRERGTSKGSSLPELLLADVADSFPRLRAEAGRAGRRSNKGVMTTRLEERASRTLGAVAVRDHEPRARVAPKGARARGMRRREVHCWFSDVSAAGGAEGERCHRVRPDGNAACSFPKSAT